MFSHIKIVLLILAIGFLFLINIYFLLILFICFIILFVHLMHFV